MLRGDQIHLRTIEPEDADIILAWENNPHNWSISNTLVPFSRKLILDYVNSAQDLYAAKQIRFMICENATNKAVGSVDIFDFDPYHQRAGLGILIDQQDDRRKGYGLEALELIKDYCFSHIKMHQLYCNVLSDNKASIQLFGKAGFEICGTKKDWIRTQKGWQDELLLQLVNHL